MNTDKSAGGFINFSNHPSLKWSEEQYKAASCYGEIFDVDFPMVDPKCDELCIKNLAEAYSSKLLSLMITTARERSKCQD